MSSHWSDNAWNLKVPDEVQEVYIGQREDILDLLPPFLPAYAGVDDDPTWEWGHKCVFSVKSGYLMLNDRGLRFPFAKVIWNVKAPLKVRAFLWLVTKRAILT